jgi:hypothetical protein
MLELLLLLAVFAGGPPGPNGLATVPGAVNPGATVAQLCSPAFHTSTIRPSSTVTNKLKFKLMDEAGIPRSESSAYELDHLISLEIGGAPDDPNNLWLQPYSGALNAHLKDRLENTLHKLVCTGKLPLAQAQHDIAADWVAAYRKYVGPLP